MYVQRPHPVILRGFNAKTKAQRTWSFEGLLERFGDEDVILTRAENDGYDGKLLIPKPSVRSNLCMRHMFCCFNRQALGNSRPQSVPAQL